MENSNLEINNKKKLKTPQEMTPEELKDFRSMCQVGKEGISRDYMNYFSTALICCKSILQPGYGITGTEEFNRKKINETIKNEYLSYTEYLAKHNQGSDYFLTEKGKDIVKRLDEISVEVKSLIKKDSSKTDISRIKTLLEETFDLVTKQ